MIGEKFESQIDPIWLFVLMIGEKFESQIDPIWC